MTATAGKIIVGSMILVGAGLIATSVYMSMKPDVEPRVMTDRTVEETGTPSEHAVSKAISSTSSVEPTSQSSKDVGTPNKTKQNDEDTRRSEGRKDEMYQASDALKAALGVNDEETKTAKTADFESLLGSKRPAEGLYKTNAALYGVVPKQITEDQSPLAGLRTIATNGRYTIVLETADLKDEQKQFLAQHCKPASTPDKANCSGDIIIRVYKEQYRAKHTLVGVQ